MSDAIIPVSRSLFLCESYTGHPDGRIDLAGVFTTIRPAIYPHVRQRLAMFVQLSGGQGETSLFFEIRRERDDELIRTTAVRTIRFGDRVSPFNVAIVIEGVRFTEPGVYAVSLFCNNRWVCDTALILV